MNGLQGSYDEIVTTEVLPREVRSDERTVQHGCAVEVGTGVWFFFDAQLPALAFGRAARMSAQCAGYRVVAAAQEARFVEALAEDRRILYVTAERLDRAPQEKDQLRRWVEGVDVHSSRWTGSRR